MLLGHFGHWSTSLLYFGPVLGLVIYLAVQSRRDRRREADKDE